MSSVSPTPKKEPTPSTTPAAPAATAPAKPEKSPKDSIKHPAKETRKDTPVSAEKTDLKKSNTGLFLLLVLGVPLLVAALFFLGVKPRLSQKSELDKEQKLNEQRVVIYATAMQTSPISELPLPGAIEAYQQASIFARTDGYVKRWLVDIGDQVKANDLLAELDTPEVDQQLAQAKATVERNKAALQIAQTAAERWDTMRSANAVSKEEADEKDSTRDVAKAALDESQANEARLTELQNFKEIRAPFAGTITFRDINVGNLISAGTGTSGTSEMYRIAQTDPLRVYVDVPEAQSPAIHPGVTADIHVSAYPNRVFHGEVVRSAGAISDASRTLRTEIRVDNKDGALLPGAYADVHLQLNSPSPIVLIPANGLIVNGAGTQVALVEDANGHDIIHIVPVKVGRDFGTRVEILDNVKGGDRLVTNPPTDLTEGMVVTAQPLPAPPAPPPSTPGTTPPPKT